MRVAILALIALFFCGCAKERAQAAADARAGIMAAMSHCDRQGQMILAGIDARLPAAADVNSADWPKPAMTPEAIEKDPAAYVKSAPPEPPHHWWQSPSLIAALGLGGYALLSIVQRAGPLLPYIGPIFSRFKPLQPVLDMLWRVSSHADEVTADKAKSIVAEEAGNLLPAAQAANLKPEVIAALKVLAGG